MLVHDFGLLADETLLLQIAFMDKAFEATLDVYYDPVEKVIEELLAANRTTSEVMVIGHSLGGGVVRVLLLAKTSFLQGNYNVRRRSLGHTLV